MNSVDQKRLSLHMCSRQLAMLLVICCLLAGSGCGSQEKVDVDRFSVLGTVMAKKTEKLSDGKGSVVLLVSKNDYEQQTPYGIAFDAFRKALGKAVTVSDTDIVETPKVLGPGEEPLSAPKFAELLQKHANTDYLVSFIRVPSLTQEQVARLPSPHPQVVAVIATPQISKFMFASKVLCLATIPKSMDSNASATGSPQDIFDANYQLITPETTDLLAH